VDRHRHYQSSQPRTPRPYPVEIGAFALESMTHSTIDESWRDDVKAAVTASAELELLEDILHVKHFESRAMDLKREPTELNSVVADALASLAHQAAAPLGH
jgi:hypothetical protein